MKHRSDFYDFETAVDFPDSRIGASLKPPRDKG